MQEVNKKKIIIFSLFYSRFCFGPQVCIGNSSFKICGFVPWHGGVRYIILHHTSYCLNTSLMTFLFTPLIIHTRHHRELKDLRLLSFVPVYRYALSFPHTYTPSILCNR